MAGVGPGDIHDLYPGHSVNDVIHGRRRHTIFAGDRRLFSMSPRVPLAYFIHLVLRQFRVRTSSHVDRVRNRFQVVGIDAQRVATQMIEFKSVGNGTKSVLVRDPMGLLTSAAPVAVSCHRAYPVPTIRSVPVISRSPEFSPVLREPGEVTCGVTQDEAHWLPLDVTVLPMGLRREGSLFSTSALAVAGRVRRWNVKLWSATGVMARHEPHWPSLHMAKFRPVVSGNRRLLPTAALAGVVS